MHTIHTAPSAKRMPMRHGHAARVVQKQNAEAEENESLPLWVCLATTDMIVARARYKVLSSGTPPGPKIRRDMMLQGEGLALSIKF